MFGVPTFSDIELDDYERERVTQMTGSVDIREAIMAHDMAPGTLSVFKEDASGTYDLNGLVGVHEGQHQAMALYAYYDGNVDDLTEIEQFPMNEVYSLSYDINELEQWIERQMQYVLDSSDKRSGVESGNAGPNY